jgi:hypothetical protein
MVLKITKTPKCYVGGAFIRSESGRVTPLHDAAGNFLCNIPLCTKKDLRNAVEAAAKAGAGWAKRTPYNRAQILYCLAEMLESRDYRQGEDRHAEFLIRGPSLCYTDSDNEAPVSIQTGPRTSHV